MRFETSRTSRTSSRISIRRRISGSSDGDACRKNVGTTRSNPRDSNRRIDGSLSSVTAANTRSAPRDRKSRSDSWTSARPEPFPRAPGSTATKYTYPIGGAPRKRIPSRKPAIDDPSSATRKGQARRVPRTAKNAYRRSNEARAIFTMAGWAAAGAARIPTGPRIARGRRTFPFQRLDVPFHLQEDREERQDARVEVGAIACGARVLPRLVQQAVEHLAVLLPQRSTIVHPVVQDRLEVQAVRRDGAAQGLDVSALRQVSSRRPEGWPKLLARMADALPGYSFVHRRIFRRHARRSSGMPLKISSVAGPLYPRAFSAFTSRSRSIVPFPKGRCSSPVSPWPPWLSCACTSPRRSASAAMYVRAPSVRLSR